MKPSTRRRFLASSALAGFALGSCGVYKWFWGDPTAITIAILKRRLGHMYVNHETFETFAKEYSTWKGRTRLLSKLSAVALPLRLATPYELLPPNHSLRRLEDSVVSNYLLSTDFFQHDASMRREIQYLGLYDPMIAICRNPFARKMEA